MDKLNDITQLYNNPPKDVKHNIVNHRFYGYDATN